jgi:general secretion pathway protein D
MSIGSDAAAPAMSRSGLSRRSGSSTHLALAAALLSTALPVQLAFAAPGTASREAERRAANAASASDLIAQGDALASAGNDGDALEKYRQAIAALPAGAAAVGDLRQSAVKRFSASATRHAETLATQGHYDKAAALLNEALTDGMDPSSEAAEALKEDLSDPDRFNPAQTPAHTANVEKVRSLLRLAHDHTDLGDYNAAKAAFQQVLAVDETNTAARRGLERVERLISTHLRSERDYTRVRMLNEVDRQWETAVPARSKLPGVGSGADSDSGVTQSPAALKLDSLRIPRLTVADLPIADALGYLARKSAEADLTAPDEASRGVNIIWNAGSKQPGEIKPVTLDLRNATLRDALRSICDVTGTSFRVEPSGVIVSAGSGTGGFSTRQFRVPPGFLTTAPAAEASVESDPFAASTADAGSRPRLRKLTATELLTRQGVPFPEGASAAYNPSQNLLTVTNTDENLDLVAALTDGLVAREQKQILIKITQLKTGQNNLRELGFDWFLEPFQVNSGVFAAGGTAGNGELSRATPTGTPGTPGYRPVDATFNVTQGPLTGGLRSSLDFGNASTIDGLLAGPGATAGGAARPPTIGAIAGVMTSPRFQTMMRGLDQKKGVDMSVAQSVIIKSGQRATGFSGRTMLYPSEFDPPQIPQNFAAGGNLSLDPTGGLQITAAQPSNSFPVTPAMPNSFTPRDIGSTIEVEGTVSEDGNAVDLNLSVIFSEFDGFINYGTPITNGEIVLTENRIIQPVFTKTSAATQVMVYDGQTVALGGLQQSRSETIEDKVPVLGSLPVVGRLFRSRVQQERRTAIIYLVTVNVVDPSGNPASDAGRAAEAAAAELPGDSPDGILLR